MINCIQLINFKCFKEKKIPLSMINLLSGMNGMGKSTMIQSLLLLRQSFELGILERGLALNGEWIKIGSGKDLLFEKAEHPEIIKIKLEYDNGNVSEWTFEYDSEKDFLKLESSIIGTTHCQINLFSDFEYICAERLGPRNFYPKSSYKVTEKNQLGIMGEYTEHYLQSYGDNKITNMGARHNDVDDLRLIYQVQAWLNEISPGIKVDIENYKNADSVGIKYRFFDSEISSNEYRPNNVGFGITYVLPVIVALVKANKGDLVIVENPEAHLHPRGQRKIGELAAKVASGGVQVILESHSDHVLNGIRLSVRNNIINKDDVKLHFFEKVLMGDEYVHQINSPQVKDDGRLTFWPDGFFDEWDKALDELF